MPTESERRILGYETERLGVAQRVMVHKNDDDSIEIAVAEFGASPEKGLSSYATIGLSAFDNGLTTQDDVPLRIEFVTALRDDISFASSALANCALNVATGEYRAQPSLVFPGVFDGYDAATTTPHGLLWYPFSWDPSFEGLDIDGIHIEWLLVIPITQEELDFIAANPGGPRVAVERLIDLMDEHATDIWNPGRRSVV